MGRNITDFGFGNCRAGHRTGRRWEFISEKIYGGYGEQPYGLSESGKDG
jgi:hypothetical protein